MPLPTFLIVGVPRAGTTSLAAYLAAHPDVFMAAGKELHYFNGRHVRGLQWYSSQFQAAGDAAHRGEATPGYLFRPDAVERMGRTVPQARIVVVLREPVDRAYSHFWLNRWRGVEPLSFPEALGAEEQRLAARPHDPRRAYFGMGAYADQLRRLLQFYPREQVHTVFFEDLKRAPHQVVTDLCRFLDIPEVVPAVTGDRRNHHGPVRSVRLAMLARRLPGPACRALRRVNTRPGEYPPMDAVSKSTLAARFAQANRDLPALVGRTPPWPDAETADSREDARGRGGYRPPTSAPPEHIAAADAARRG